MRALVVALALVIVVPAAAAERRPTLRVHRARDLTITFVGGFAFGLADTVGKDALSPARCRWCDTNALDRSVRDGLRWRDPGAANWASNLTAYAGAPLFALGAAAIVAGRDDRLDEAIDNGVVVAQAVMVALGVNYTVKALVGRERPDVHALAPGTKPGDAEDNLSFYSGHTTLATSLAVATGTVATLRGYRGARAVWLAGVPMALATGYLRVAADRHWATDVIGGWVMGAVIGAGVPWLFHRPCPPVPVVGRAGDATTVGVALAW